MAPLHVMLATSDVSGEEAILGGQEPRSLFNTNLYLQT